MNWRQGQTSERFSDLSCGLVQLLANKALVNCYIKSIKFCALGSILILVICRPWGLGKAGERKSILVHGRDHGKE